MELPGKRIAKWREFKGITTRQLSEMADIPYSTLKTIETNENADKGKPSFEVLAKLRKAFPDLSIDWILDGTEPMLREGVALTKKPMLSGGDINKFGATVMPAGSLEAQLGPDFGEDIDGRHKPAPKVPANDREFIDLLVGRIKKLETLLDAKDSDNAKLHNIIEQQQGTVRFLQDQVRELQTAGKIDGNQLEAPGTYTAEPSKPIGFQVRVMYPNGIPVHVERESSEKVAA